MYKAYVTRIKNIRKHPNADRLQLGECFGNTVVVSLEYVDNQLGVYFPSDGQLSKEFAEKNNLLRKKDAEGNNVGGYMDENKRNVTAIRLRGEKSDGLFLPLTSLSAFGDISILNEGDIVSTFNGYEIACKYIPKRNQRTHYPTKDNKKVKVNVAPLFKEHTDTEQLAYNLSDFKTGDEIEITLKMHGTSQRTGYLPVLKGYKRTLLDRILRRQGEPIYEYDYISGTRRVVLNDYEGGFYGSNAFRKQHSDIFKGKLEKGETVYYEVVGFTDDCKPIMANGKNSKLGKEFEKLYGKETVFSYGCSPTGHTDIRSLSKGVLTIGDNPFEAMGGEIHTVIPQSDIYVYRMTMTNEDGYVVEYTPDFMRYRCEQMGVKTVPVFAKFILHDYDLEMDTRTAGEVVKDIAEHYYNGTDPVGKTHIREGVVVRILNRPKFTAYKHKNFSFKVLEGIIKETATEPDMEEAQEE